MFNYGKKFNKILFQRNLPNLTSLLGLKNKVNDKNLLLLTKFKFSTDESNGNNNHKDLANEENENESKDTDKKANEESLSNNQEEIDVFLKNTLNNQNETENKESSEDNKDEEQDLNNEIQDLLNEENNSLGNGYKLFTDEGGYTVSICDSMNTQKIEAYIYYPGH